MTDEEISATVREECPEMLSDCALIGDLKALYADDSSLSGYFKRITPLEGARYDAFCKVRDRLDTATVGQLVAYLKENFRPDDRLCRMDCVEGVRNDCVYVKKSEFGERLFYRVKDLKRRMPGDGCEFPYVKDDDVIIC